MLAAGAGCCGAGAPVLDHGDGEGDGDGTGVGRGSGWGRLARWRAIAGSCFRGGGSKRLGPLPDFCRYTTVFVLREIVSTPAEFPDHFAAQSSSLFIGIISEEALRILGMVCGERNY